MSNFLIYLKEIWDTYPIEFLIFIFSIFWSIIITINKNLPIQLQLNKKYSFWKKIKHTICSINVSIRCDNIFNSAQIQNKLSKILKNSFRMINNENGKFLFKSLQTDSTYLLEMGEMENEDNHTIVIRNDNAFKTTKCGKIKGLQELLNELQGIINIFSGDKVDTEKIISQIKIIPKKEKGLIKDNLEVKIRERNCFISCNMNMIKIITEGISNSKSSVERALYKWIEYFI